MSLQTWVNHLEKQHPGQIPDKFTPAQYFYYLQTGKDSGSCIMCHRPTDWNEASCKYNRFCNDPKCKEEYRELFKKRMLGKYGKVHLLNDPNQQRKMLAAKNNSGEYQFADGGKVPFVSTYERDFLVMLDTFLHWNSSDIMGPSPHTYYYNYKNPEDKENEGEKFYIPDFFIPSLNLEIEVKQNTSTHPKILRIDKVKEVQKDAVMNSIRNLHYLKIVDKNYDVFFKFLLDMKEANTEPANEALSVIEEGNGYKFGYEDITKALNEHYDFAAENAMLTEALEVANYSKEAKYPVFVILSTGHTILTKMIRKVTGDEFSHASISFSENLDPMYSFGAKKFVAPTEINVKDLGFVMTNPTSPIWGNLDCPYAVFVTYVTKEQKMRMEKRLQFFIDNKHKMKYSFVGLIKNLLSIRETSEYKWFCSRFVTSILQAGMPLAKDPTFYKPQQLSSLPNFVEVGRGPAIQKADIKQIKDNLKKIKSDTFAMESIRSELPDDKFGIPSERKYPLDTEAHVRSAIKFFNYVEDKYEKQLANNILNAMKEFNITDVKVGENNRFKKYYNQPAMERYVMNTEDIYYNKEAWEEKKTNMCFIIGHSGSGKSTMARNMYRQDKNIEYIELDDLQCIADRFSMDDLKKYGDLIYSYFNGPGKKFYVKQEYLVENKVPASEYEDILYPDFVHYAMKYAKKHSDKRIILEGVWIFGSRTEGKKIGSPWFDPSEFDDYAFYIKGTSMLVSKARGAKRDSKDATSTLRKFYSFTKQMITQNWKWYFIDEKRIEEFRKHFQSKGAMTAMESVMNSGTLEAFGLPATEACKDVSTVRKFVSEAESYAAEGAIKDAIFNFFGIGADKDATINTWKSKIFGGYNLLGEPVPTKYLTLSKVLVDEKAGIISIQNINYDLLVKRIRESYDERRLDYIFDRTYKKKDIALYNKKKISRSNMRITSFTTPTFFALELTILFRDLYARYRTPLYAHLAKEIYNKTWLSKADNAKPMPINMSRLNNLNPSFKLKDYQEEFIRKYPELKARMNLDGYILAFDQGLGKTLTAAALAECIEADQVFIVCPNTLTLTWKEELNKYFNGKYESIVCGNKVQPVSKNCKYFITNNEGIKNMMPYAQRASGRTMLIVDEMHNFRNYEGIRVQELIKLKETIHTKDALLMSGTPIKALPSEITPALKLLDRQFTDHAAKIYTSCFKFSSYLAMDIVKDRFSNVIYRKTKDEVLKLPNKTIADLRFNIKNADKYILTVVKEKVREVFRVEYEKLSAENKGVREEFVQLINQYSQAPTLTTKSYLNKITAIADLTNDETTHDSLHELDQQFIDTFISTYVANNPRIPRDTLKLLVNYEKKLVFMRKSAMGKAVGQIYPKYRAEMFTALYLENKNQIVAMINNCDKKTVIFSQSLPVVKFICDNLNASGIPTVKVIGGTSATERSQIIDRFKYDETVQVIVATSQSMSTGVTLTCASQMFFFGPPYRNADFDQCCDRIYRIGQDVDVHIYNVLLNTSPKKNLSDRMDDILNWSKDMFDAAID